MDTPYEAPAPASSEQRDLIKQENKWRNLFAERPDDPEIQDIHLGLIDVFANSDRFVFQDETPEEKSVPKLLTQHRQLDLKGPAIVSKDQFLRNFQEFTQGCLRGLNWKNVFAAGGAVLGCLASNQDGYRGSDIDLFIWGITNDQEANQKLKELYNAIVANTNGRGDVIRTNRAITILCSYPFRHVQIILRLYKSPAEVLLGFDIDSCCVGYDGTDVWCQERFKRALTKRYNLVNTSRRSITYEQRLFKYSKRGFAVAVPNLDKTRVNPELFQKEVRQVQGLAKLLIYDYLQNMGKSSFNRAPKQPKRATEEEGSDYNNDLPIPWGPEWQTDTILNMLNTKNKAKFFSSIRRQKVSGGAPPQQPPQGQAPQQNKSYNHMFTSNAQKLQGGDFSVWNRSLDNKDIQKPIEWIKDNPAYQDFDNGFRRLMTGSFEPIVGENWEEGVYLGGGQKTDASFLMQKPFSSNSSSVKDAKGSPPRHQGLGFVSPKSDTAAAGTLFGTKRSGLAPAATVPTATSGFSFAGTSPAALVPSENQALKKAREKGANKPLEKTPQKKPKATKRDVSPKKAAAKPTKKRAISYSGSESSSEEEEKPKTKAMVIRGAGAGLGFGGFASSYAAHVDTSAYMAPVPPPGATDDIATWFPQPGSAVATGGFSVASPPQPSLFEAASAAAATVAASAAASAAATGAAAAAQIPPWMRTPEKIERNRFDIPSNTPNAIPTSYEFPSAGLSLPPPVSVGLQPPTPVAHSWSAPQAVPSASYSIAPGASAQTRPATKLLLLVALSFKQGSITSAEKGVLKDMIIANNPMLLSALEVFEIDQDLPELVDTLRRVCKFTTS